jgi:crossover junction endodeoxyribonuclease RusA
VRRFTVPGRPYPQGSLRAFKTKTGAIVTPQKNTVLSYRGDIQNHYGEPSPVEGPVAVTVEFRFMRPKSHFNKSGLKPAAPVEMTQSPDVDKLARAVLDALTAYAYHDDKQVVTLDATKVWWHKHETVVAVEGA